jgi:hypothetical protein
MGGDLNVDARQYITWDRTVCMEGMMKPCETPMHTLANMIDQVFVALVGVSMEIIDHEEKEMISMIRPPYI